MHQRFIKAQLLQAIVHFLNVRTTLAVIFWIYRGRCSNDAQPFETFEQHFQVITKLLKSDFDLQQVNADIEEAEH